MMDQAGEEALEAHRKALSMAAQCSKWRRTRESAYGTCLDCGHRAQGYEVHERQTCRDGG